MRYLISAALVAIAVATFAGQYTREVPPGSLDWTPSPAAPAFEASRDRSAVLATYLNELHKFGEQQASRMSVGELEAETELLRIRSRLAKAEADLADLETVLQGLGRSEGIGGVADGAAKAAELRRLIRGIRLPESAAAYREQTQGRKDQPHDAKGPATDTPPVIKPEPDESGTYRGHPTRKSTGTESDPA